MNYIVWEGGGSLIENFNILGKIIDQQTECSAFDLCKLIVLDLQNSTLEFLQAHIKFSQSKHIRFLKNPTH